MRKASCGIVAFTAAAVAITLALHFVRQEYEATCGLAYGYDGYGETHCCPVEAQLREAGALCNQPSEKVMPDERRKCRSDGIKEC